MEKQHKVSRFAPRCIDACTFPQDSHWLELFCRLLRFLEVSHENCTLIPAAVGFEGVSSFAVHLCTCLDLI